jgi:hypothetical protein
MDQVDSILPSTPKPTMSRFRFYLPKPAPELLRLHKTSTQFSMSIKKLYIKQNRERIEATALFWVVHPLCF